MSVVSIIVWRLAGDTLNITYNFLYCNHQVHRDFLITLYVYLYAPTLLVKLFQSSFNFIYLIHFVSRRI
jgi:hypothetical protein